MPNAPALPMASEFVTEGTMLALPLCFPGQSSPPPPGETAITCMAPDPAGSLYLGTCGTQGHVLVALLRGDSGAIFDMGRPPEVTSIDGLAVHGEHVYAVTSGPAGCAMYRWPRIAGGFLIQEWTLLRRPAEKVFAFDIVAAPAGPGGRIADLAVAPDGQTLYGVTEPAGELVRIVAGSTTTATLARLDPDGRFSRRIVVDGAGRIWGTRGEARIWRCEPGDVKIEDVAMVPAAAGRAQHTQASAWALDERTGILYGGTTPDGFLFRLDPETCQVVGLGKPTRLDEVNCLTVGRDGRVFGTAGLPEDIGHLFCYDPGGPAGAARGDSPRPQHWGIRDLGIPVSVLAARQYGYHFRCMMTGPYGEIYLGQHERISHLWIYFPPVAEGSGPSLGE